MIWPFSFKRSHTHQAGSHIGGELLPSEAAGEVRCLYCNSLMPLFFRVNLEETKNFKEYALLMFACVSCAREGTLIPDGLNGELKGANVESVFLRSYQKNFRCLLLRRDLLSGKGQGRHWIKHSRLEVREGGKVYSGREYFGQIGGKPEWMYEDESPRLCDWEKPFEFIFQLAPNKLFAPTYGAPGQVEVDLFRDGETFRREAKGYDLFIGNAVYFFAVTDDSGLVYVITQKY